MYITPVLKSCTGFLSRIEYSSSYCRLPRNLSMVLPWCILMSFCIITLRHSLCSIDSNLLVIPKTTTVTYGDKSFVAIAPKIWNQLLLAIRQSTSVDSFERALKPYLFWESAFLFSDFHFIFTLKGIIIIIIIIITIIIFL